jgi:aspartate racemase
VRGVSPGSSPASQDPVWKHVIGVIGGLGPHAHVEFETLLLRATEQALARPLIDQDYPSWVLSSIPSTPDRTRAILEGTESPVDALVQSADRLTGADFAVIPCNTAHAFLDRVRPRVILPILDMVLVTAARAVAEVGSKGCIGILAASGTIRCGIYLDRITRVSPDVRVVTPLDLPDGEALQESCVMEPIYGELRDGRRAGGGIKSGSFRDPQKKELLASPMRRAAEALEKAGAGIVLTACTEIPLVLGRDSVGGIPLLDPMAVAAERAIDIALGNQPLPS